MTRCVMRTPGAAAGPVKPGVTFTWGSVNNGVKPRRVRTTPYRARATGYITRRRSLLWTPTIFPVLHIFVFWGTGHIPSEQEGGGTLTETSILLRLALSVHASRVPIRSASRTTQPPRPPQRPAHRAQPGTGKRGRNTTAARGQGFLITTKCPEAHCWFYWSNHICRPRPQARCWWQHAKQFKQIRSPTTRELLSAMLQVRVCTSNSCRGIDHVSQAGSIQRVVEAGRGGLLVTALPWSTCRPRRGRAPALQYSTYLPQQARATMQNVCVSAKQRSPWRWRSHIGCRLCCHRHWKSSGSVQP